jgi:hypothetical protein
LSSLDDVPFYDEEIVISDETNTLYGGGTLLANKKHLSNKEGLSINADSVINSPLKRVNKLLKDDTRSQASDRFNSTSNKHLINEDVLAMLEC